MWVIHFSPTHPPAHLFLSNYPSTHPPLSPTGLMGALQLPQSVGFVGGKPNHAIYFVGSYGQELTGLDPHTVQLAPQPAPEEEEEEEEEDEGGGDRGGGGGYIPTDEHLRSVQCRTPQVMQAKDLDPSLALGFYLRNEVDFEAFVKHVQALQKALGKRPALFSVEQAPPEYGSAMMQSLVNEEEEEEEEEEGGGNEGEEEDEEDEYVIVTAG